MPLFKEETRDFILLSHDIGLINDEDFFLLHPAYIFQNLDLPLSLLLELPVIDQFRYIKIQLKTIALSTRLWGINHTNSVFIPRASY